MSRSNVAGAATSMRTAFGVAVVASRLAANRDSAYRVVPTLGTAGLMWLHSVDRSAAGRISALKLGTCGTLVNCRIGKVGGRAGRARMYRDTNDHGLCASRSAGVDLILRAEPSARGALHSQAGGNCVGWRVRVRADGRAPEGEAGAARGIGDTRHGGEPCRAWDLGRVLDAGARRTARGGGGLPAGRRATH